MKTQEPFMLYKLIVLYMLENADFSLTNSQVSDFILNTGYTDFLTLQMVISQLTDSGMITTNRMHNRTFLSITSEGKETIDCLEKRLSQPIRSDIRKYLSDNSIRLKNELSIRSGYSQKSNGDYETELIACDKKGELINIKMTVPTQHLAISVCEKWEQKKEEIYGYLTKTLL